MRNKKRADAVNYRLEFSLQSQVFTVRLFTLPAQPVMDWLQGTEIVKHFPISPAKMQHLEERARYFATTPERYLAALMLLHTEHEGSLYSIDSPAMLALARRIEASGAKTKPQEAHHA